MPSNSNAKTIALGAVSGFAIAGALAAGLVIGMNSATTTPQAAGKDNAAVIAPMFSPAEGEPATSNTEAEAPGQGNGVGNPQRSTGGAAAEAVAEGRTNTPAPLADQPVVEPPVATGDISGPSTSPRDPLPPIVTPTPTPETAAAAPPLPTPSPVPSGPAAGSDSAPPSAPAPGGSTTPTLPPPPIGPCVVVRCDILPPIKLPPFDPEPETPLLPPVEPPCLYCGLDLLPDIILDLDPEPGPAPIPYFPALPTFPFSPPAPADDDEEDCPPGVLCLPTPPGFRIGSGL